MTYVKGQTIKVLADHDHERSDTWYQAKEEFVVEMYLPKEDAYVTEKDFPRYGQSVWVSADHVELVEESSIARPVLEERKVGKVKMQLFDEGFPNAILEIAKVMTWAETAKGYQPNDFKNLPNAETEFSAAASRHRVKGFIQKAEGVAAIDRTDEESNIVHLAHTAFNILAELELVLTGKIK